LVFYFLIKPPDAIGFDFSLKLLCRRARSGLTAYHLSLLLGSTFLLKIDDYFQQGLIEPNLPAKTGMLR
jgi:hypothetical protein